MKKPNNIIIIVLDSLRYDSIFHDKHAGLKYIEKNAICFTQARSGGCWTLPSTASMFTGLMPHQHQTTSQTRYLPKSFPTLAEKLKSIGYQPIQITGNMVTTHIFGLDRGFDHTFKIWNHVRPKLRKSIRFLMMLSRPRVRKEVLSGDFRGAKMSQFLNAGNVWAQCTYKEIFQKTRRILEENKKRNQKSFLFLNLMETHFPYHVDSTFRLTGHSMKNRILEVTGLYHMINQSFLKKEQQYIQPKIQRILKHRQRKSWRLIRHPLDNFIQNIHQDQNNLVIVCSDHGDNFGDQGWFYHFSNVTEAGNRIPLFWLGNNKRGAQTVHTPVSLTAIHNSILAVCGLKINGGTLFENHPSLSPILQSYWYNNHGQTLEKYKFNQLCFIEKQNRYLLKKSKWYYAPIAISDEELPFSPLPDECNPVEEFVSDKDKKIFLKQTINDFIKFSDVLL